MIGNGRVLVPMRTIFEVVGVDVQWVAKTSTVKATKGVILSRIRHHILSYNRLFLSMRLHMKKLFRQ
ncbi:stalk domain-containing protein [Heyndrickxia oleronia]|uniref:stalk domain-containing protein n=1 Tax=Heyndrickxia oleronia TaxID=38875 RepID=UPI00333822D2